jgi:hypothetical protein
MKYTVAYSPLAEYQLADIWVREDDKDGITSASAAIDRQLRHDPDRLGEPDERGWRLLVEPPLAITFEVSVDDRKATVLSVRYRP